MIFNPDSDSKACAYKFNNNIIIYEIDFSNDTLTEKYISGKLEPNSVRNFIEFLFIDENKLYFLDTYKLKEESDEEKEEREIIETEKRYLLSLDLSDGSFEVLNDNFRGGANCICTLNDRVFFNDYAENRIYTTDMNFENEATILEYDDNLSIKDISYDENTGEFYVLMATYDTSVNSNAVEGNLYFIDSEMNCEKISMPSEQILNFRLTKEYFYYMVYDPVSYGNSPRGMACIDETGSKIYRVKRGEMSEPELVFDGRGEIFYSNFEVIGNYLYLDYMQLIKMDSMAWFRYAYSTARINIKDKTIKWLNLD